jgi:hypothetical protein
MQKVRPDDDLSFGDSSCDRIVFSTSRLAMSLLRTACLVAFLAFFGYASAQPTVVPLVNFVDMPVPAAPARLKPAIVHTALIMSTDVVEASDGSLIMTQTKFNDYSLKFKITYDASKFSVIYLDSTGLRFNDGRFINPEGRTYVDALERQTNLYRAESDTRSAVKTDAYIQPSTKGRFAASWRECVDT